MRQQDVQAGTRLDGGRSEGLPLRKPGPKTEGIQGETT